MRIRIGYEMSFAVETPTVFVFLLNVLPDRALDLERPDQIIIDPVVDVEHFIDHFGNRSTRIFSPSPSFRVQCETVIRDSGLPVASFPAAQECATKDLPTSCLQFLLPSRYCESDALASEAWRLFGHTAPGWSRVQAVCDWVHNNVEFGYKHAHPLKTAQDVFNERKGVCRDLTHLAITFCRALNIPARYATGYLGDIGVPISDAAMDFSACFQVFLDNEWHLFDARHNIRRIGWILMATGRDAADCALTTSFGPHILHDFLVTTEEIKD